MRLARREDERVAVLDGRGAVLVANNATPRNDMVKFPLRAVRVIGISRLARWDALYLHVKGMPLLQIRGLWLAAQFFRDLLASVQPRSLTMVTADVSRL